MSSSSSLFFSSDHWRAFVCFGDNANVILLFHFLLFRNGRKRLTELTQLAEDALEVFRCGAQSLSKHADLALLHLALLQVTCRSVQLALESLVAGFECIQVCKRRYCCLDASKVARLLLLE